MKKLKKIFVLMLVATTLLAIGCTSKDESNITDNDVSQNLDTVNPIEDFDLDYSTGLDENGFFTNLKAVDYVELVEYDKISVPSEAHIIPDDIVQANIDNILSNFTTTSEVTDRAVVDGDTVNIDYVGSVDGVEFEGGSTGGNGTNVTIGVTSYIDDFLEQLIGHNPGESFDIEVTFPEDYGTEDLNGKNAIFAITINNISETVVPELTDEFVAENLSSTYESNTVEELRTLVKSDLKDNAVKGYIQDYLLTNTVVSSIPEEVLQYQQTIMENYYKMSAVSYGMTLEEFLASYVGYDSVEALMEASAEQLDVSSQFALVIQAIAEDASIAVTDEALSAYFIKYTGSEEYEEFEEIYGLPYLKNSILQETVLDYLVENAELVQ
ncbi:MAG: trigger factor [Clostridiales bacterium]|nr:trigger factor [Clostridiales bacterium]